MHSVHILQIGDVHLPEHAGELDAELKDDAAPGSLTSATTINVLREVVRHAVTLRRNLGRAVVLVCGDLTSFGRMPDYDACVTVLRDNFLSAGDPDHFHAVPGNHDVARPLAGVPDLTAKFRPAMASWNPDEILPIERPRVTDVVSGTAKAMFFSLNSCIGSGERRYLPAEIQDKIFPIIEEFDLAGAAKWALGQAYEQLDTPAFDEVHLNRVIDTINETPRTVVPVVLAHHNLLPQATLRVEIYTEVVNGGSARARLSGLGRHVLYLHGHTHTSPVDEIRQHHPVPGTLLCIGAKEFVRGFNHLCLQFNDEGEALGCVLTEYTLEKGGAWSTCETRIPLRRQMSAPTRTEQAVTSVLTAGTTMRFPKLKGDVELELKNSVDDTVLEDSLRTLAWSGQLEILDDKDEPKFWHVSAALT